MGIIKPLTDFSDWYKISLLKIKTKETSEKTRYLRISVFFCLSLKRTRPLTTEQIYNHGDGYFGANWHQFGKNKFCPFLKRNQISLETCFVSNESIKF